MSAGGVDGAKYEAYLADNTRNANEGDARPAMFDLDRVDAWIAFLDPPPARQTPQSQHRDGGAGDGPEGRKCEIG